MSGGQALHIYLTHTQKPHYGAPFSRGTQPKILQLEFEADFDEVGHAGFGTGKYCLAGHRRVTARFTDDPILIWWFRAGT